MKERKFILQEQLKVVENELKGTKEQLELLENELEELKETRKVLKLNLLLDSLSLNYRKILEALSAEFVAMSEIGVPEFEQECGTGYIYYVPEINYFGIMANRDLICIFDQDDLCWCEIEEEFEGREVYVFSYSLNQ